MMTDLEKGALLKLFNRSGYVLDFSTAEFDVFTMSSVGVALCHRYGFSKGKSLNAFISEASAEDAYKLFSDLLSYYETQYRNFENETREADSFGLSQGEYRKQYLACKGIIEKYKKSEPNTEIAKSIEESFSTDYMSQQIKLMLDNQETYPAEAIGKAKELIESCCRTILDKRSIQIDEKWTFQQLVNRVFDVLEVKPEGVDENDPIASSLKKIYGNLKGMVHPVAEIRNSHGTGHGKAADFKGLDARHAKLLVGMSTTLVRFLWETHETTEIKNGDSFL